MITVTSLYIIKITAILILTIMLTTMRQLIAMVIVMHMCFRRYSRFQVVG